MNSITSHKRLQRLQGLARKAIQSYNMIAPGDNICVGVSGGKDSVALALVLKQLSAYHEHPFGVHALTLDPCFGGKNEDYSVLSQFFAENDIPHTVVRTDIGPIVFDVRHEKNPCSLCANIRRGALHTNALELGCNKIALGHHLDDAVETFYMNLFLEGRIGCFSPYTFLSRKEVAVIRPFVFASEYDVSAAVRVCNLPIVKSKCPVDKITMRSHTKAFVEERTLADPAFCKKTLGALQKSGIDGWALAVRE